MTLLALLLCLAWLGWTGAIWFNQARVTSHGDLMRVDADPAVTPEVIVAYASQTGTAKALAQHHQATLGGAPNVALVAFTELKLAQLAQVKQAVFVVSTYGDGEPPDNGRRFFHALKQASRIEYSLTHLAYQVVALGDRRYPQFCQFGHDLHRQLVRLGALASAPMQQLDASQAAKGDTAVASHHHTQQWQLVERQRLTQETTGGLYRLRLQRVAGAGGWRAGDLVDVMPPVAGAVPRRYSIASSTLASAAATSLTLIVRQQLTATGELGLCSGWLTQTAAVGEPVTLRLLENGAAHMPASHAPLLLIGAGSGWAGLRAHVCERGALAATQSVGPTWVVYGERTMHKALLNELQGWQQQGALANLTFAWSRDTEQPTYVHDRIIEQAASIREFIGERGHIYVCGRFVGMGTAVDDALQSVLGPVAYQQCIREGRYHRDLY